MNEVIKAKRGAPRGNKNARKHGFYSKVVDKDQRRQLKEASLVKGLDGEIDLLRVKLQSIVERDPDNVRLILQAASALARLLRTRRMLGEAQEADSDPSLYHVVTKIGAPLNVDFQELARRKSDGQT